MEQRVAIVHENTINIILEQQQKILQLLQGKSKTMESTTYCSVREAAQILCVSEQKVRQMVDDGKLKKKENMGRAIRIYRSSLI